MKKKLKKDLFKGRTLVIASKHKKETVISPLIELHLGVKCIVPDNLNTDLFGTFSGEIERIDNPIQTLRNKCLLAMEKTNCDLAIASEGSFGPHPTLGFIHADEELLMLVDKKNNLEISTKLLSTKTNFNAKKVETLKELQEFAKVTKFPSHGLIIRTSEKDTTNLIKGVVNKKVLLNNFIKYKNNFASVYLETDMRAMYNPSRMRVIKSATRKLIKKINCFCPKCKTPGFSVIKAIPGLHCNMCGFPTQSTLSYLYKCQACNYSKEKLYPHRKKFEEPNFCNNCNP